MTYPLISRNDALQQGLKRYYHGRPCKYGHDSQRFVTTGNCVACSAGRSKIFAAVKNVEAGKFVYPLAHPGDHAVAWAFCQALDMARGSMPTLAPTSPAEIKPATAAEIEAHRARVIGSNYSAPVKRSNELHPFMAEQLRRDGYIK